MKTALIALLSSKKFLMAILAIVAAVAARFGLGFDPAAALALVSPLIAAIVAQGVADHGSTAATINAAAAPTTKLEVTTPAPSGSSPAAAVIAKVGGLFLVLFALAAAAGSSACSHPSAQTTIAVTLSATQGAEVSFVLWAQQCEGKAHDEDVSCEAAAVVAATSKPDGETRLAACRTTEVAAIGSCRATEAKVQAAFAIVVAAAKAANTATNPDASLVQKLTAAETAAIAILNTIGVKP